MDSSPTGGRGLDDHERHTAGCECPRTADLDGDGIAASSRRTFLHRAGALGAGTAAAGLLGAAPAYAAQGDSDPYGQTTMSRAPRGTWDPDPDHPGSPSS